MNRKNFLRKSIGACASFYFGYHWLLTTQVLAEEAKEQPVISIPEKLADKPQIKEIYWTYDTTDKGLEYIRLHIMISEKCEVLREQKGQTVRLFMKNCLPAKFSGKRTGDGRFFSSLVITPLGEHCEIVMNGLAKQGASQSRCTVNSSGESSDKMMHLQVDMGPLFAPGQLKESDLGIKETALSFGPLEIRPTTDLIVIHHVGNTDEDISAAEIHELHLGNGWSGIGYHYVIHKNGSIERGRPLDTIGAHAYQFNDTSVGINLVGNFEISKPTEAQLRSAAKLIAVLCNFYSLHPDDQTVVGHRDLMTTDCPGQNLYEQLPALREKSLGYI